MDIVLSSAVGEWSPLVLLAASIILVAIVYILRSTGSGKHKKGTDQGMPFFSGNRVPEENLHPANLYWGFFETMRRYYKWLLKMHNGIVNDYVYSFILLIVIMLAAMVMGGMI
jgi:NADH:ubiquinone oxidoreductase subunit 6 (subunit J)